VEIVISLEKLLLEVVRAEFEGRAHIVREGPFCVCAGNEDHAAAAGFPAVEHLRLDPVLLHGALEEVPEIVVADFPEESGGHPEDGGAGNSVGCRAAGDVFYAIFFKSFPNPVTRFHVDVLHAAEGEMVFAEKAVVRKDGKDVCQCVADAEN